MTKRVLTCLLFSFYIHIAFFAGPNQADALSLRAPERKLAPPYSRTEKGRQLVLWLSIDGVRPDYLNRTRTPNFDQLFSQSVWSKSLKPVFPTTTFPTHVSQVTGTTPNKHGITGNSFYDREHGFLFRYPNQSNLLESEPLWVTAKRQGKRVGAFWPMAYGQSGEHQSDYTDPAYNPVLSDEERLEALLDILANDEGPEPLALLLGYIVGPDSIGHTVGPDAPGVLAKMREVDTAVGRFVTEAKSIFRSRYAENDRLHIMISTDHGMSPVTHLANLRPMAAFSNPDDFIFVMSANIGHIYLDKPTPAKLKSAGEHLKERFKDFADFAQLYTRENLPESLAFAHPRRSGDFIVLLKSGYTFYPPLQQPSAPLQLFDQAPRGMHGYHPLADENMRGFFLMHSYPKPLEEPRELTGDLSALGLHATAAGLLGIEPSPEAAPALFKVE